MRTHGTLTKWNDARGFGFITQAQSGSEIFVHISEFPSHGGRPQINEIVSFEKKTGPDGKLRAVRIMRAGEPAAPRRRRDKNESGKLTGLIGNLLLMLVLIAIALSVYKQVSRYVPEAPAAPETTLMPTRTISPAVPRFQCDGRTMCSQMTSCAEAEFFLRNCPGTQMDGNNDGEPCERQWCNSDIQ